MVDFWEEVAKTFRVCDRDDECNYVMKVQDITNKYYKKAVRREIEILKYVSKTIPFGKYVDDWDCEGGNYLVISYINGSTLLNYKTDKVDKNLLDKLFRGIWRLHGLGIVHRDLKASNIIVDIEGDVHLTDYGQSEWRENLDDFEKVMVVRWDFERVLTVLKESMKLCDELVGYFEGLVIAHF